MNDLDSTNANSVLGQEWMTLQNNYEQYERTALFIKLAAIAMYVVGTLFVVHAIAIAVIVLLWVQEGVYKTYQSRLGLRLLRIEAFAKQSDSTSAPFQLHTEWLSSRKGMAGLFAEYAASIAKPTVAFPYAVLLLLNLIAFIFKTPI